MSSTLSLLFKTLLALSDDPQLAGARNDLLEEASNEDLINVINSSSNRVFARKDNERIAATLLDIIAREEEGTGEVKDESEQIVIKVDSEDDELPGSSLSA